MKPELYQVPTLALLAALVAVFGALWLEGYSQPGVWSRSGEAPTARRRQLLWLAGWTCAVVQLAAEVAGWSEPGPRLTISLVAMELTPLMFLASLAPQYITRKPPILYIAAFGLPVMVYCAVAGFHPEPGPVGQVVLLVCAAVAIGVAARWSLHRHLVPIWLSLVVVAAIGACALWMTVRRNYWEVGQLVHGGVLLMTALLFIAAFRRLTAGLVFTVGGLTLWSLPAFLDPVMGMQSMPAEFESILNLVKVITAVGMIVLVLEDALASNVVAQERDRRARLEMEKYSGLYLEDMPFDQESGHYNRMCETIAGVSRFAQAAIFVQGVDGTFRLAGHAGMSGALEGALDALAQRTTEAQTLEVAGGNYFTPVVGTLTLMDLTPLMQPGDELEQMNFRRAWVMGVRTRAGRLAGVLMLAGLRNPNHPLLIEDVLPLELLVARLGAAREHVELLRRLMQSERLAGLGRLAGGVAHELNNPLQAVTGFAQLLTDANDRTTQEQAGVILSEARRMKQIIESLMRFRNAAASSRSPVSVELVLRDIENLARHDLDRASVILEMQIPDNLPRVKADPEQIRQVFLQVMRNAIASLEGAPEGVERRLRVEVAAIPRAVEVMFSDTGPGFAEPARAFDPFFTSRNTGDGVALPSQAPGGWPDSSSQQGKSWPGGDPGLGLSICYAIIREHGGEISAVNLHPRGAAVVIELPTWSPEGAAVQADPPSAEMQTGQA